MYLNDSLQIIAGRQLLVVLLALPGCGHLLFLTQSSHLHPVFSALSLVGVLCIPAIYGMYLEDIKGKKSTLWQEFKKRIGQYIFTAFVLHVPLFVLSLFAAAANMNMLPVYVLAAVVIEALTVYVLPLVFITDTLFSAIPRGIVYGLLKAKENPDLVLLTVVSTVLAFSSYTVVFSLLEEAGPASGLVGFALTFASACISCCVFVTACLRLKDVAVNE